MAKKKRKWGGYRPGSGRRPKDGVSGVSHHTRQEIAPRHPVLVTLKTKPNLGTLRKKAIHQVVHASLIKGCDTGIFRICHYSVQKHTLYFLVETQNRWALSRGVQGVSVRIAKGLNNLWSRTGSAFADRYDAALLTTGRQVRDGLLQVLNGALLDATQARKLSGKLDPYSSAIYFDGWKDLAKAVVQPPAPHPVVEPRTNLLRHTWRRYGLLGVDEVPP